MEWQLTLSIALVTAAVAYLALRGWRTWRARQAGCAGGCGCDKSPARKAGPVLIPADQLTVRRVKRPSGSA